MDSLSDIVEIFELLEDWEERYDFIVDIGENLPLMPNELKIEDNRVKACMSKVWTSAYTKSEKSDRIYYHGDCDTSIIKGVLAILIQLCNGKTVFEIQQLDVDEFFDRLQLAEHLSPNRHVGVYAIVELMKQQALQIQSAKEKLLVYE